MLTQLAITAAKPQAKPYKLGDGGGLYILIEPNGSKSWRFRYKIRGKENMLSLGVFPIVTLAQARGRRDDAQRTIAEGKDPSQKRREERLAGAIAAKNTFGVVAEEYLAKLKDEGAAQSTLDKNAWLLLDLAAPLYKRPVSELMPAEILDLLKRVEKSERRDTARRLRGVIGTVCRYAVVTLRAQNDPTYALRGALLKPDVQHRAAITDERNLGALMVNIDQYDGWPTLRAALLLLALTMTRPGDVRLMRKTEIVFPKALWRIPAERMKMRRPHDVPLSRQALVVIRDTWDLTRGNDLVTLYPLAQKAVVRKCLQLRATSDGLPKRRNDGAWLPLQCIHHPQ